MTKYEIFAECFPQYAMGEEIFDKLIYGDKTSLHRVEEAELSKDGELAGFALFKDNALLLICIAPRLQKQGYGSKLLANTEQQIKGFGYNEVTVGESSLFVGAPEKSWGFFEKNGYKVSGKCDEMSMELRDFDISKYNFKCGSDVAFDWYSGDESKLLEAVAEVDEDWIQYFRGSEDVYCAKCGEEIASFCLVDYNSDCIISDENHTVGMVGCVGTVPKFRNRGIGIKMAALATDILKNHGTDRCFIHYTGVAEWYKKIGYKTFLTEIFGRKEI